MRDRILQNLALWERAHIAMEMIFSMKTGCGSDTSIRLPDSILGLFLIIATLHLGVGDGPAGAFGIDIGLAAPIVSDLWIGAKATNINQPEYGSKNNEKLPRELSIGLSYQLSDIALFTSDVVKDVQFPISYRGGLEVSVIENLLARAGITVEPLTFSGGFGYSGEFWAVNIAVQRHENRVLGYNPAIDFKITW